MEKIRAAIIGLGRIASLLEDDKLREKPCTHAGAIAADGGCRLAGGSDRSGERRRLFAERWGVPVYADAEAMIREQRPEVLVIATHPDSHAQYCRLGAAHKVPVLICEKPLAGSLREARRIAALHAAGGTRIITNHERRYSADYRRAKAILAGGTLGPILGIRAVLYMGRTRRLLDVFWHDGTHLADAVMFLGGGVLKHRRRWGAALAAAEGTAYLAGTLGGAPAAMETGGGRDHGGPAAIPVVMEIGAGRDHLVFEIEFSCERGRLRIGNGIFEVWESGPSPYAEQFRSLEKTEASFEGPTACFAAMIQDAAACVRDPSRQPESSALEGLRVIEYLHSVGKWKLPAGGAP